MHLGHSLPMASKGVKRTAVRHALAVGRLDFLAGREFLAFLTCFHGYGKAESALGT